MKNRYKLLFVSLFAFCLLFYKKIHETLTFKKSATTVLPAEMSGKDGAVLPDSAISGIREVIASREYYVTFDEQTGVFQSPNRK